ncbi:MAG: nitroreductase/quinone reductase family protein [Alphaproteobacteria bacterium]
MNDDRAARRALPIARLLLRWPPSPGLARRIAALDVRLQRRFGRCLSSVVSGVPMAILTTRGRRTGLPRSTPVACLRLGGELFVVAGNAGSDRDPDWARNALADPRVEVEIGPRRFPALARRLDGDEREAAWARVARACPQVRLYAARTARRIPVLRIEPLGTD